MDCCHCEPTFSVGVAIHGLREGMDCFVEEGLLAMTGGIVIASETKQSIYVYGLLR